MNENNQPVSALRQRMLEDMQRRKLGAKTQSSYIRAVKNLSDFLHHPTAPSTECAPRIRTRTRHRNRCEAFTNVRVS